MGLLKYLVIATIFSYPLGQLTRVVVKSDVAVTLTDVLVAVTCISWATLFFFRKVRWLRPRVQQYIFVFTVIVLVSLVLNAWRYQLSEVLAGSLYLVRWLFYSSLYFIVQGFDGPFKKRVAYLMLSVGSLFIGFGYVQYIFYPDLRNLIYLGWDDHLFRLFSTVFDPNFAAVLINLYLFLIGGMILNKINNKTNMLVFIALFLFGFLAMLLTYSRSGYLMFTVGALTMLFLASKKKLMILVSIVLLAGLLFIPKNLPSEGVNLLRTASIESRFESIQHAPVIIKDNPIFGVGFNMYRYAQEPRQTRLGRYPQHSASSTDNSFLFVFATTGVIGFFAYLLLWRRIVTVALHDYHMDRKQDVVCIPMVIIGSSFGLFVNAMFLNSLFYPSVMLWMWVLIGLIERK